MADARSQLAEIDALIADSPDDPSLLALKEDLLQLIALEEQAADQDQPAPIDAAAPADDSASASPSQPSSSDYTAKGAFTEHSSSREAIAEAPELSAFQPVASRSAAASSSSQLAVQSGEAAAAAAQPNDDTANTTTNTPEQSEKKRKKKKKAESDISEAKFELPSHLVPLESDSQAQKLKKQRTAKALKSKFREKQKEMVAAKKQNDWKSFAMKKGGKKKAASGGGGSIFSTEEGVNARVGVISGGGGRKMTDFAGKGENKRHKFN